MKEKLQGILQSAKEQLAAAADARALDEARVKFLGKKGELTALLKGMKDVAAEERPVVGQLINDVRAEIETIIDKQKKLLEQAALEKKLAAETIDVTLPGDEVVIGKKHPLNIVLDEFKEIFLGLGFSIAEGMAKCGATICFNCSSEASLEKGMAAYKAAGIDAHGYAADVSDEDAVNAMVAKIKAEVGPVDILVNNAATLRSNPTGYADRLKFLRLVGKTGPKYSLEITKNMSDEDWEAFIHNNLNSVFYCCREALKIMEPKHYGRIINMSSIAGLANLSAHSPHYSSAKGGVVAFTRSLALEVAGAGITVNSVAPGMCEMEEPGWKERFMENMTEEGYQLFLELIPLGRFSTVQEQANTVTFLASDAASYITGQTIAVNGGMF